MSGALWAASFLTVAAGIADWRRREVPQWTVVGLVGFWCVVVLVEPGALGANPPGGLVCGVAALAVGLICFGFGWMGAGDAKLLPALGLWLGPEDFPFALSSGAVVALALIIAARRRPGGELHRRGIPLATALAVPAAVLLATRALP